MKNNNQIKVIIDTNIWISFLIGKKLRNFEKYIFSKKLKIVISSQLIKELLLVTKRPKLKKYFPEKEVKKFLKILFDISAFFEPKKQINLCRDSKDNFLLSLIIESKADYLVTGDKNLLIIQNYKKTRIINYKKFELIFKNLV